MRIHSAFSGALVIVLGMTAHAVAFDIKNLNADTPPAEALRYGIDSYRNGDKTTAVEALSFAAKNGSAGAQWKLANMYAKGDGVERNDYRAFELFSDVANHATDDNSSRRYQPTPFVTNAWAKLGDFFRKGIPNSDVKADPSRAREYFWRAAYFGDADAQLNLATMFYNGEGGDRDLIQAAKWANLAADKGNQAAKDLLIEIALELTHDHLDQADKPGNIRQAAQWAKLAADYGSVEGQALYGHILFMGDGTNREPVQGLMYLTIALDRSGPGQDWILTMHEDALAAATAAEWQSAKKLADEWMVKNQAKLASGK
jgi:TPR repeat protein